MVCPSRATFFVFKVAAVANRNRLGTMSMPGGVGGRRRRAASYPISTGLGKQIVGSLEPPVTFDEKQHCHIRFRVMIFARTIAHGYLTTSNHDQRFGICVFTAGQIAHRHLLSGGSNEPNTHIPSPCYRQETPTESLCADVNVCRSINVHILIYTPTSIYLYKLTE